MTIPKTPGCDASGVAPRASSPQELGDDPAADPATPGIATGCDIALLGIDPATRKRNRVNGTVVAKDEESFTIHVEQSFGNCPKYMQRRSVVGATRVPGQLQESCGLGETATDSA